MSHIAVLLAALGQIESGDNDRAVGAKGEITRYQMLPLVWHVYRRGPKDPQNPAHAVVVAESVLRTRVGDFRWRTEREPSHQEVYALWNAPGAFAHSGYRLASLRPVVRERCERYANLVARLESSPVAAVPRLRATSTLPVPRVR
jgi:hypothetical protein